jgi:zinc and cadmium transporter
MQALLNSLAATFIVSLISLAGIFSLALKDKLLKRILLLLVGFSAGAMLGGAFLHLIPESLETMSVTKVSLFILAGFAAFFIIERVLHWHHCHKEGKCNVHMFTYMSLIGDAVHNFIDGIIIAGSFVAGFPIGIVTTIAVISHEIPQELGDFGVLIYGGFSKIKAFAFNFISALTAVLGAVAGYFLSTFSESIASFLVPFAAGSFIYIAASDLIPELHKEPKLKKSMLSFLFFLAGIAFIYFARMIFEH